VLSVFNEAEQYDFDDLYRDERTADGLPGQAAPGSRASADGWRSAGGACAHWICAIARCKGSLRSAAVDDLPIANQDGTGALIRCSSSSVSTVARVAAAYHQSVARPRRIRA